MAIQIIFKSDTRDIVISGDSVEQIVAKYNEIIKRLDLAIPKKRKKQVLKAPEEAKKSLSIRGRILSMKGDGFFESKRTLDEVKEELAKKGVSKPITTLSPYLTDLVQDNELKRDKKKTDNRTTWVYYV